MAGCWDFNDLLPVGPSITPLLVWHVNWLSILWETCLMFVVTIHPLDDGRFLPLQVRFNYFMILIYFLVFAWVISNVHEIWGKKKYKILNLGMQWGRDNDGSLFECACECLRCCDSNFSRDMGKFTLIIIWLNFYSGFLFACIVWHI